MLTSRARDLSLIAQADHSSPHHLVHASTFAMLRSLRSKALLLSISSSNSNALSDAQSAQKSVLQQVHDFEVALQAMDLLLDDRGAEGTALLKGEHKAHQKKFDDPAAIFPLALGVMEFIEATLGFEAEVMARAHKTLLEAENASLAHSKYNVKHRISTSHIYPPGTEFQVTYAELTLLNALVMLLQEDNSMMDQAKALLKLRKAYQILDATYKKIKDLEPAFNRNLAKFRKQAEGGSVSSVDLPGYADKETSKIPEDQELIEKMETVFQMRRKRVEGSGISLLDTSVNLYGDMSTLSLSVSTGPGGSVTDLASRVPPSISTSSNSNLTANTSFLRALGTGPVDIFVTGDDSDSDEFADALEDSGVQEDGAKEANLSSKNIQNYPESIVSINTSASSLVTAADQHLHVSTVEEFIHSGVQLCFGILQTVLSLIPPAIGRVLSIVGFKGNRKKGLQMLWRTAITSRNIHGELALLFLLVFYDGPIKFVDTGFKIPRSHSTGSTDSVEVHNLSAISDKDLEIVLKHPELHTPQLLRKARTLFPHNCLWLLQEGRMHVAQGNTKAALDMMQNFTDSPDTNINMEQVEALLTFDRAIFYIFVHDFDQAARDFIRLLEINSWSLCVYLFLAGSCYLEKWRMIQSGLLTFDSNAKKAEQLEYYAKKADHYLKLAPTYIPNHGVNAAKKKGGIGGSQKQMPFDKFVLRKTKQIEARVKANDSLLYIECVGTSLVLELVYFWNGYNSMDKEHLEMLLKMLEFSCGPLAKIPETSDEAMIRNLLKSICLRQSGHASEGLKLLESEVIGKYVTQDVDGMPFKFQKMTYSPYLYPTGLYERALFAWDLLVSEDVAQAVDQTGKWLKKAETISDTGDYELSNRTSMMIKAASERMEELKEDAV